MKPSFVHLHVHTQFSLLDGANQIDPLIRQVKAFGQPAIAVTDHGNMFGAIEFYRKAKEIGVKPIIGCEVYMALGSRHAKKDSGLAHNDYYHLILLARNGTGYQNLIQLVSKGYIEGFYYKPRIDKDLLRSHHEGLIALSGCLSGEIPYLIRRQNMAGALAVAKEFEEIFGKGQFFLEVQANGLEHQRLVNAGLIDIHNKLGIPLVGTNDCHYLRKEDARPHELMLCLQTGKTLSDPTRMKFDTDQLYVKSTEELVPAFAEFPGAVANTCFIAEACNLELTFNRTYLPQYKVPEGFENREAYLEHLAITGLKERLRERPPARPVTLYEQRLREELMVICSMGFAGYFLIVWDIIRFAQSRRIPVGPGRGSAAGSLVAYALRITNLDPLEYGLLFERFLNPERVSLPDIDMDFCMERREEVINYVVEKYGTDHVAQIITFGTLGAKAAIRDVGRVLEMPYAEVDKVAKLVPNQLNITLQEALELEPQLRELVQRDPKVAELISVAQSLEGLARHASTHAAGVVISDGPLTDYVPLYKGANDEIVTQYSMGDLEKIGLVKFDFLGLKTLTMIRRAETLINERRPNASRFRIEQIPFNDEKTFALLSSGKTTGIFQLESSGMRDLLIGLKPDRFEDIIAIIALYRPGPMDLIPDFIKRKQGKVPILYEIPELEPILKETYGVIVYQEQVMAIANKVAGFTLGQADILRRAMGKKKPEEMEKLRAQFLQGAVKNKIPHKKAERLYELIYKFAGYGFNKSHAAAYAVLCYQTAYLKAHYPTEFMAALMTTDMGNTDKIMSYFTECRELGIKVLGPDINVSGKDFTVVDDAIRFGLAAIKNVGESAVESIIAVRNATGPFLSLFDFCRRIDLRKVNKRMVEGLIKTGAFDSTGAKRAQLLAVLDQAMEYGAVAQRERDLGQTSIFGEAMGGSGTPHESDALRLPSVSEWDQAQRLKYERELTGFYISAHPLNRYEPLLAVLATTTTRDLAESVDGKDVNVCGIIVAVRSMVTKKGDRMAYLTLEDLHGTVEVIAFPDVYKIAHEWIVPEGLVRVCGVVDRGDKGPKLRATKIEPLADVQKQMVKRVCIRLAAQPNVTDQLLRLREVLQRHPGGTAVSLVLHDADLEAETEPLPSFGVSCTEHFMADIEEVLGKGALSLLS
ncbi:MAG: DNA polymerase III subunit alpha [Nitrospira sp.]|nr:DNA polymerase III subunit alpha [Nitrospira sp.]